MAVRLAIAGGVIGVLSAVYLVWKRPPGRLVSLELGELGVQGPAIVQFTTRYCAPCRAARPELEAAADRAAIRYTQIDVGERPDVARRYGIRTVPTIVVAARSGRVLGKWTALPGNGEIAAVATRAARR
jgi:thioredoxin-like negative regulator of GroEL